MYCNICMREDGSIGWLDKFLSIIDDSLFPL